MCKIILTQNYVLTTFKDLKFLKPFSKKEHGSVNWNEQVILV